MQRKLSGVIAVAACLLLAAAVAAEPAPTAPIHKKRHVTRHWHGYGFLPGYAPEVVERERAAHYYRPYSPQYLRPGLAGLLSRALEWRRLRPLLDADADWSDVELRPLIDAGSRRR